MSEVMRVIRSKYYGLSLGLLVIVLAGNLIQDPTFLSAGYLAATCAAFAPLAIAAMASTPAILSGGGGIDVSIAPLMTLVNVVLVASVMPSSSVISSPVPSFLLAVLLGAGVGVVNGLLVTRLRYQPILATLCVLFVLTGIGLRMAPTPVSSGGSWTDHFAGSIVGVPGGLVLIAMAVAVWVLLGRTQFMANLYAVGRDDVAAYSAGVDVHTVRLCAYALGGAMAGLGGIALTAILRSGDASVSATYVVLALTAVALGGTSLAGGRGGMIGSLSGAATIFLVQHLLTSLSVPSVWLKVTYGCVLLLAVVLAGVVESRTHRKVLA